MRAGADAPAVWRHHGRHRPGLVGIELAWSPLSAPMMLHGVLAGLVLAWGPRPPA